MHSGFFISFEGLDGSGKTSVIDAIKDKIKSKFPKINFCVTSEVGGTSVGKCLCSCIINNVSSPITEAYVFAAARAENVEIIIKPKLKENWLVIADRYLDSSIVYQGMLKNVGIKKVYKINKCAVDGIFPDVVFILISSVDKAIQNIKNRINLTGYCDGFDGIDGSLKTKILKHYNDLVKLKKRKYVLIDANGNLDSTVKNVWIKLYPLLLKKFK